MKLKPRWLFVALALIVGAHRLPAQNPVITSFGQNGVLVCSNLSPGSTATVAWAPSLSGPWQTNWAGLHGLAVGESGIIQVSVPMFYRVIMNVASSSAPTNMVRIPAGTFCMGDWFDGESDAIPTDTTIAAAYYMDSNLVSSAQWQTVFSYAIAHAYSFANSGAGKAADHPVQMVNWYDCVKWCNARSQREGLTPVYYKNAEMTNVFTSGEAVPFANWAANGYRLPTEAEWERAARGGVSGRRFPWGNTISQTQANYRGNFIFSYDLGPYGFNPNYATEPTPYTSPVGSFAPNDYGLYDMVGNAAEWTWDWYGPSYAGGTDPHGPASGSERVLRGGSWYDNAFGCAHRFSMDPQWTYDFAGFRCVRGL